MNRSWNNYSKSSPGFVYFPQDNSVQQTNGSPDFIPFGNSPKHSSPRNKNNFSPAHYSSPRFKQNHNRYNNMRQNYPYDYNRSRSFNSSNDSFGSYDSFRGRNRHRRNLDSSVQNSSNGKRDMSAFLDLTCLDNPWEDLEDKEAKLPEDVLVEANQSNSNNNSSSEDETESLSEEKSSGSTAEEDMR